MTTPPFGDGAGFDAGHNIPTIPRLLVAPATAGERNTIRLRPVPIACARLNQQGFHFDSSLVTPEMIPALQGLGARADATPGSPLSLFGHADPVGDDEYNKRLSGRRAAAVYGLLTRSVTLWERLYLHPAGGDDWTAHATKVMLGHLRGSDGLPYVESHLSWIGSAVQAFQRDNALTPDGAAGPATRKVLFSKYMDAVCIRADGSPYRIDPERFIGKNADPEGKGAYQGCSELNPVFLFAAAEASKHVYGAAKEERDRRNGVNRRVLVFFFRAGTDIAAADWPCPRASEGVTGCRGSFWPDGEVRRQPGDDEREYRRTHDTFACRFYDGFARRSPCEGVSKPPRETLVIEWPEELTASLPQGLALRLTSGKRTTSTLWTDGAREGERRRFVFEHVLPGQRVTLSALTAHGELRLWNDQPAHDPESPPSWEHWLEELLVRDTVPEGPTDEGPSSPDDVEPA